MENTSTLLEKCSVRTILLIAESRETCARCGRAIMEAPLKALGQVYHPNCFVCSMCPQSLEGTEFFVTEDNKPMCKDDFARFMAKTCDGCQKKIIDETLIATNSGKHFHKDDFARFMAKTCDG